MNRRLPHRDARSIRQVGANDVITTNNLVLQAQRALDAPSLTLGGLLDLAALVEAVILHDHLLFLESASQFDFSSLPIANLLLKKGVIASYVPPLSIQEVQESIYRLFGIPDAYDKVSASPVFSRAAAASVLPYYGDYDFFSPGRIDTMMAELDLAARLPLFDRSPVDGQAHASTLPHYCFSLVEMWAKNNAWARRPAQAFLVRTLVYWAVADRMNISFYPDIARQPIVAHITHHLQQSLRLGAFPAIAQAFFISTEELERSCAPLEVAIPAFTLLVLERTPSLNAFGEVLLEARRQFSGLRKALQAYQQSIRQARRLAELENARQELSGAMTMLAEAFAAKETWRVQETTSYHQRAARYGGGILAPEAYSAEVRFKPADWLRAWWLRRNTIHLCDGGSKLEHFERYAAQAQRLYPEGMDAGEQESYRRFAALMRELYG